MSSVVDRNQRSRRVLTDLRAVLKPMNLKERMDYLDKPEWIDFFNNMACPRDVLEELKPEIFELYESGMTIIGISKRTGVSVHKITYLIKKSGLKLRDVCRRKLSDEDVFYIKSHPTETLRKLADKFNVSPSVIQQIRSGKTYKEIKIPEGE